MSDQIETGVKSNLRFAKNRLSPDMSPVEKIVETLLHDINDRSGFSLVGLDDEVMSVWRTMWERTIEELLKEEVQLDRARGMIIGFMHAADYSSFEVLLQDINLTEEGWVKIKEDLSLTKELQARGDKYFNQ